MAMICVLMCLLAPHIGKFYGTPILPTTPEIIETLAGSFSLLILIVLTFWSGEMLWKIDLTNLMKSLTPVGHHKWLLISPNSLP